AFPGVPSMESSGLFLTGRPPLLPFPGLLAASRFDRGLRSIRQGPFTGGILRTAGGIQALMIKGLRMSPRENIHRTPGPRGWVRWPSGNIRCCLQPTKRLHACFKDHPWRIIIAIVMHLVEESFNGRVKTSKVTSRGCRNQKWFINAILGKKACFRRVPATESHSIVEEFNNPSLYPAFHATAKQPF
ncbi:MAG: hypothetical protein OXC57_14325, partial [Rhodobacteraceae bacterium]|nr:hypothetical protein [Paracoccaceae bacterium]